MVGLGKENPREGGWIIVTAALYEEECVALSDGGNWTSGS